MATISDVISVVVITVSISLKVQAELLFRGVAARRAEAVPPVARSRVHYDVTRRLVLVSGYLFGGQGAC